MKYELFEGDCLEVMKQFPDGMFDFVFVDPPYNKKKDYGTYKDDLPESEYFEWVETWIREGKRISNSMAIYPPKTHLLSYWNMIPENHQIICGWTPIGAIRSGFIHQYIPLLVPPKPKRLIKDHWLNIQMPGLGYFYREEKFDHPGQTSMELTRKIIEAFTNKDDIVIDFFLGIGTTGVACAQLGRRFVGIELDHDYFEIAKKRIEEAYAQPTLFEEQPQKQEVEQKILL